MKKWIAYGLSAALAAALLVGCASVRTSKAAPLSITVWNYYNGTQQKAFNALVEEFNATEGKAQGIYVDTVSFNSVSDLTNRVLAAAEGKAGAEKLPNIFSAYTDTAYQLDKQDLVVDLNNYFTQEELSEFVGGYVAEGYFTDDRGLKILPIAKSTEVLLLNETAWREFADATGATYDDLATLRGMTATAQKYYEWTDSLTPEPNDGKAFFGRDSLANYMLVCAMQQGVELFSVDSGTLDLHFYQDTVRDLWDNYYVPYVKGYFAAQEPYRSDDVKLGVIAAYVGSTSGATYFPDEVFVTDTERVSIEMTVLPSPQFYNGLPCAVQQGAGMVVTQGTQAQVNASILFLKWFTQTDRNLEFAVQTGYLPVNREANQLDKLLAAVENATAKTEKILEVAVETVQNNRLYTPKAFETGASARTILENCMSSYATQDRAVVVQRLAEGQTLEQAVEEFVSDAYFEQWYAQTKAELEALEH